MPYKPLDVLLAWLKGASSQASPIPMSEKIPGKSIDCLKAQRTIFDSPENKFKIAVGKAQEKYGSYGPNPNRIPGKI